jgi:hypothetical protein
MARLEVADASALTYMAVFASGSNYGSLWTSVAFDSTAEAATPASATETPGGGVRLPVVPGKLADDAKQRN